MYRSSRHIHGIEADNIARRCLILTLEHKLVLVLELPCHCECRVVQLFVDILVGQHIVIHLLAQMCTEGFYHGEYDLSVSAVDGISLDKVKSSVDVGFVVGIQAVEVHHLQ